MQFESSRYGTDERQTADQLLLLLGISASQGKDPPAKAGSSFRTLPLTRHSTTQIEILRRFLDIDIHIDASEAAVEVIVKLLANELATVLREEPGCQGDRFGRPCK